MNRLEPMHLASTARVPTSVHGAHEMREAAEHDVRIGGRVRLAVRLHEQQSGAGPPCAHPWAELLAPPGGSDGSTEPRSNRASEDRQADAPVAGGSAVVDDIDTQTLLDGLEELYELDSDDGGKASSGTVDVTARSGPAAQVSAAEADVHMRGGDKGGPSVAAAAAASSDVAVGALSEREQLADMEEEEAKRIIGSLGGFSRPDGAGARRAALPAGSRSQHAGAGAAAAREELPEMGDSEARRFVQAFGGFGRLSCPAQASGQGPASPRPAAVGRAVSSRQAAPPAATPATPATPAPSSPFPSKSDVLSARRALKMDRGRAAAAAFNSPTRTAGGGPSSSQGPQRGTESGPSPGPSPGQAVRRAVAGSGPRMLTFKHPGLKRPSSHLRFNSPTKRVAAGVGGSGEPDPPAVANGTGANGNARDAGPGARPAQLLQPFRSPAKTGQLNPDARPLPQGRPPPVLPPVTSRPAGALVGVAARRRAAATTGGAPAASRPRLGSLAGQRGVGDLQSVPLDARTMTADAAADYCYGVEGAAGRRWGAEGARQALVARGCVAEAVSAAWVRNHFRWIVWSSAGLARRFPARWREFWSAERVLELLHGRYRREYECGERAALRRILEADAAPQRLMVLCIASVAGAGADVRVEVTDGWYGMQACADAVLARAIGEGRLRVGDKIACAGLGVRGVGDGVAPLSAEAQGAALLLTANCVRRGRWDAMLGFQRRATMAMALSAVHRLGGAVGATLDVVVVRRYPLRFMETAADGRRVVRSAKEEEQVALAHAEDRAQRMLDLLEERRAQRGVAEADDEEALAERVEQELPQRQVHALLRMLVCDYPARPYRAAGPGRDTLAVVTVWRPGPIEPADLAEGSRVLLTGATVSPYRGGSSAATGLHLSIRPAAGCLCPAEADPHVVARSHYCRRATLGIDELQRAAAGEEVDVAGEVEQCCASASSQMLVLRLRSAGRDGSICFADVEFPPSVFGCLSPPAGTTVTVRNCRILPPARDADAAVPRLHAGDVAEFAF